PLSPPLHLHSFPTRRSSDLGRFTYWLLLLQQDMISSIYPLRTITTMSSSVPGPASSRVPAADFIDVELTYDGRHTDERQASALRSEEHTSELQSRENLVCRL